MKKRTSPETEEILHISKSVEEALERRGLNPTIKLAVLAHAIVSIALDTSEDRTSFGALCLAMYECFSEDVE